MGRLLDELIESADFIRLKLPNFNTKVGIILGSGLGNLTHIVSIKHEISYEKIPHFPVSTVKGHTGKLIWGTIDGVDVLIMSGRFHFYEGYTAQQVVFPVRVMKILGIETLLLSNAAGSVNPTHKVGDLMIIKDYVSFFVPNPLIGENEEALGTRFPDMTEPYDLRLIKLAKEIALESGIDIKEGVYCAVTGPTFESIAEYKLIKILGCDVVGMSTVQETIAAVHCGIKVFAVSVVTDLGIRDDNKAITHEEVLHAANEAEPKLTQLFRKIVVSC